MSHMGFVVMSEAGVGLAKVLGWIPDCNKMLPESVTESDPQCSGRSEGAKFDRQSRR